MALYNLARGGLAPEFGSCKDCGCDGDEHGLPLKLEPDLRFDGGYGFRDKVEWKQLMAKLDVRYGKAPDELKVGDQLIIFLQPNHSTVKSLFVDFNEPLAGFKFKFVTLNGTDLAGKQVKTTYSEQTHVESVEVVDDLDTASVEERTQWTIRVEDGYNPKVDAIVLEIEAMPQAELSENIKMLFARRFEQDGYMMTAR